MAWDATTIVVVHAEAGGLRGLGWTYADAACGPPGLLAEEYDVRQRQLRGNLPQAFVHAMLLEAAQRLS